MRIGVLALQGAVQPHVAKLAALGAEGVLVRRAEELDSLSGLILPGGESTTFLNLIQHYQLQPALLEFAARRPLWGVCAGAILMAQRVEGPSQASLGVMPLTVVRNAYGAQNESFIASVQLHLPGQPPREQEAVFIRAPRVKDAAADVQVLAQHAGHPVTVQYRNHLLTTFHPELSAGEGMHAYFAALCDQARARHSA